MSKKLFKEKYNKVYELAKELEESTRSVENLDEWKTQALEISALLDELYENADRRQQRSLRFIYFTLCKCSVYFDCFRNKLESRLHLGDKRFKDWWTNYIENMLLNYSYRVFNDDLLRPAAHMYIKSQKFSTKNVCHILMVDDVVSMNKKEETKRKFIDDSYNEEYAKTFMDFIAKELKEKLEGYPLVLGVKIDKEKLAKEEYDAFVNCPKYDANIIIDNSKVKFVIPKNINLKVSELNFSHLLSDKTRKTHDYLIEDFKKNPNPITLLRYLISVYSGNPHYTYLSELIEMVLQNGEYFIFDYDVNSLYRSNLSGNFIKILCRYFMMYANIIPSTKHKAYEYLILNLNELVRYPNLLRVVLYYLPKEMQSILTCYHSDVKMDDYKTLFMNSNPLVMNSNDLKIYLNNITDNGVYNILNTIKEGNVAIFEYIVKDYSKLYEEQLELEKQRALETIERQKIEEEKRRIEEEENLKKLEEEKKRLEKRERLRTEIHTKHTTLSEEEFSELIEKTDNAEAMFKIGLHYFLLASKNPEYFRLSSKYCLIAGSLGSKAGYFNASIAMHNLAVKYKKDSDEYNKCYAEAFEIIENSPLYFNTYCAYVIYSMDVNFPVNKDFIENGYKELMADENVSDKAKKYVRATYYLYQGNYGGSVMLFNEIRDYVSYSIVSMYVLQFIKSFNKYYINVKFPKAPEGFFTPFDEKYEKYRLQMAKYDTDVQTAIDSRNLIDWACELEEPEVTKYKAKCLYYGHLGYEKKHEEALILFDKFKDKFTINDDIYREIYDKLLEEFESTNKQKLKRKK